LRYWLSTWARVNSQDYRHNLRIVRALLLVLVSLLLWPAAVSAETPAEYRAALEEAVQSAVVALSALPAEASLAEYPALRQALLRLESIDHVTGDSGANATIDNRGLVKRFLSNRDEGLRAYDSLRQLVRFLETSVQQGDWTKEVDTRLALDKVLGQPEFRSTPGPISRLLDGLRTPLFRWLEELFAGLKGMFPHTSIPLLPGAGLGLVLLVTFFLLAGGLAIFTIAFFVFTWRRAGQNMARYAALQPASAGEHKDARTAQLSAQRAADEGDYRRAIHFLYLWAILHLVEHSRLRYDRSQTNREQLRALAGGGEIPALLRSVVDAFDHIWYGHTACTATEYGHLRSTVERIVSATK